MPHRHAPLSTTLPSLAALMGLFTTLGVGCAEPCTYTETAGTAVVTYVSGTDSGMNDCADEPREVGLAFIPEGSDEATVTATLTVGDGANPPLSWLEAEGLTEGSEHPAVLKEIIEGTCTPTIIELTDVDYEAGTDACG